MMDGESVRDRGIPITAYGSWLGVDQITDADQTLAALGGRNVDWLVVDHYAIDITWEQRLCSACNKLMIIDDLADRPHKSDLLLDQNYGRNPADYRELVNRECTVLTGPEYALIRPQFAELRSYSIARRHEPTLGHIVITMGGVDRENVTSEVLTSLKDIELPTACRLTIILGARAPWKEQVKSIASQLPWEVKVLVEVENMAELMSECDLAIAAAGSTSWELCCLGLPFMLFILAENQRFIASALDAVGAAKITSAEALSRDMEQFLGTSSSGFDKMAIASTISAGLTSGAGAQIVSDTMFAM
jgi:UDP-2,4-diacetamido-2,4,6-trideoxy-beta-L-altropyranose hydrolase